MNRRETLIAPLALAALAAHSIAGATTESEILRLYAEWKATEAFANSRGTTDAEFSEAEGRMHDLESRILALPAKTAPELAAKVMMLGDGQDMNDRSAPCLALWAEMRTLVGGVA